MKNKFFQINQEVSTAALNGNPVPHFNVLFGNNFKYRSFKSSTICKNTLTLSLDSLSHFTHLL